MNSIPTSVCLQDLNERFEYLFEPELIAEICEVGERRSIPEDSLLMDIGQEVTHVPLIISGSIKIMTEDEKGDELLLYYLEVGDTCAMTLNNTGSKRSAISAISEEPCDILFIPKEKTEEWMVKYKGWRNFVMDSFNSRLKEMLEAIDNLAFHNMEERLTRYLRDKAMVHHSAELKTTHYQIAADLHSSRVVISRLMKKLEMDGIIKQHRNRVEFLEFKD